MDHLVGVDCHDILLVESLVVVIVEWAVPGERERGTRTTVCFHIARNDVAMP